MLAAKGASQSLHRDPECRRITGKDGGMEMGARRSGSRIFIVMLAILAFTLIVVGAVLIATGRLCITSSHRPVDRYEGVSGASNADLSADLAAMVDADSDGIADNDDVLAAALVYIQTRPHYKSVYYPSGYPDDEHGGSRHRMAPSRAGRRVTTFRHSSRPTLRGVQRPRRSRFRIRRRFPPYAQSQGLFRCPCAAPHVRRGQHF